MISVIIPTLNRDKCLNAALTSLVTQAFPVDQFEVLVVDNGSTDTTRSVTEQFIAQFPHHHIQYLYEPEPGLLSGRHRGALAATGDVLVFIDDDIEAHDRWLQALEESFRDPTVQLVGGRNLPNYESEPPEWLEWFWYTHPEGRFCAHLSLLDFGDVVKDIDPNFIWGLNFAIRKQTLLDLGGFHPDCVPSYLQHIQGDGETGLTQKAIQHGYRALYHPQALVFHQVSRDRMTHAYFERRSFYQGVADSYSSTRKSGSNRLKWAIKEKLKAIRSFLKDWRVNLRWWSAPLKNSVPTRHQMMARCQQAYLNGYQFHQRAVWQDPVLLDWVLKADYWDYKLPSSLKYPTNQLQTQVVSTKSVI